MKVFGYDSRAYFSYMSPARWAALGAISLAVGGVCALVGLIYTQFSNAGFSDAVKQQAVVDVVGLSFGLAIPVTATLVMKLFQVRTLNKILEDTASRDPLTGCLNRRALVAAVEKFMGRTPEPGGPIQGAFLLIDADHFKHINDRLGHVAGDAALQMIAAAIRSAVRDTDIVARVGGEEFVAFLPGVDPESARQIAERIVQTVNSTPFAASGGSARLAVSVGGATFDHSVPFDRLYRQADDRLYQAKESGRNKAITAPLAA